MTMTRWTATAMVCPQVKDRMETKTATLMRALWTGSLPIPENIRAGLEQGGWDLVPCDPDGDFARQLEGVSLVVLGPDGVVKDAEARKSLFSALDELPAVSLSISQPGSDDSAIPAGALTTTPDTTPDALSEQLSAVHTMVPTIDRLRGELCMLRRSRAGVDKRLEILDEEMRLAARLQRDFLPRRMPEVGNVQFGVMFRPAGWVSGDIYDVARLDETHVGFYVVDAVGHGMPAALLTMFIKKSLQTKHIVGHSYEIVPPNESLAELNDDICSQNLSSCQFCTAIYCVLDTETMELSYARAGHPEAILLRADGSVESIGADGALLGIFPEAEFECRTVQLTEGDRVVLYTDGVEDAIVQPEAEGAEFLNRIATLSGTPQDEMLLQVTSWIDGNIENTHEDDDITMMLVDVGEHARGE
jgi:serine phosphatase RsbU (regulator of sigma subunit)